MTPSEQIDAILQAATGSTTAVDLPVDNVVVTYIRPPFGANDFPSAFVQAEQAGPAAYLRLDVSMLTPVPAAGDIISFRATSVQRNSGQARVLAISDYTQISTGNPVAPLVQDVSNDVNLTSAALYESEILTAQFTVASEFEAAGGSFMSALVTTSGVPDPDPNLEARVPNELAATLDLTPGCQAVFTAVPTWRFLDVNQISAFDVAETSVVACPAPQLLRARSLGPTSVELLFNRNIAPASLAPDGGQFTFTGTPAITASAATLSGRRVTVTTSAQGTGTYTATAASSLADSRNSSVVPSPTPVTFQGRTSPLPSTLVISQIYGGGGNSNALFANDFVELFNNGAEAVDLTDWSAQYSSSTGSFSISRALSGTVAPGGYFLIAGASGTSGAGQPALPTPDFVTDINLAGRDGKILLSNATDLVATDAMGCPLGAVVDFVGYGNANCGETAPAPRVASGNGEGLIRAASGCTDTDDNSADFVASAPAPRNSATTPIACP